MKCDELYNKIEKMYKDTIKEISDLTGLDVNDVDKFINETMDNFFNGNLDINNIEREIEKKTWNINRKDNISDV